MLVRILLIPFKLFALIFYLHGFYGVLDDLAQIFSSIPASLLIYK